MRGNFKKKKKSPKFSRQLLQDFGSARSPGGINLTTYFVYIYVNFVYIYVNFVYIYVNVHVETCISDVSPMELKEI